MADNIVSSILRMTWPVVVTDPAAPNSGDPVRFGSMTGIAMLDEGDGGVAATVTVVDFGRYVADHPVTDVVGGGIAVGATVYYDDGADRLENDTTGTPYGVALEAVGGGATTTIQVLHCPHPALGAGTVATASLAAGVLSADVAGRAKMAAGYFDAATALDKFAADSITNAVLLDAVQNGAFVADANTRALFADNFVNEDKLDPTVIKFTDTKLESADVKALKATPITLVAAPGADLAIVPVAVAIVVDYGGTNAFTETADDLSIGYLAGAEIMEIESTGLIDQANDEWRYITFEHAETFIPEENVAVCITNLDDEIGGNAGADNEIHVRLYYRLVPTDSFIA
jgi:predicted RecA/RadA family phage recombinase